VQVRLRTAGDHQRHLGLSKVEAGKLEIERRSSNSTGSSRTSRTVGETANAKGVEMLAHCQPEVPTHLVGDPTRLRQILLKLGSNAVKFTARGESCSVYDDAALRLRSR